MSLLPTLPFMVVSPHLRARMAFTDHLAAELGGLPVKVVFNLVPSFLEATIRQCRECTNTTRPQTPLVRRCRFGDFRCLSWLELPLQLAMQVAKVGRQWFARSCIRSLALSLKPSHRGSSDGFMLKGLAETEQTLRGRHVPFQLLSGWPTDTLPEFIAEEQPAAVVCDMSPLRVPMAWVNNVAAKLDAAPGPKVPLCRETAWRTRAPTGTPIPHP